MAGRCSAAPSLRRETVERLDGRPRHDLIPRSPRSGRLEGRSRRRRRARWSLPRDATPAAPLLRTRRQGRTAATLSVTVARKIRRKPLKRLIPRPGLRRTRNLRPSRPARTCFETRRFASLLSMRAASARPPSRRPTIARKFCCKPLKRLNPRPAFRCPPKPSAARMRRDPGPARPPLTRSGERRRRLTITRKIRRKPLKRLIPRPGLRRTRNLRPSRPAGTCFETRRFASLLSMRAASARPPSRRPTIARKFCCKPLKRLNPRPAFRCPPKPSAARMRRDPGPARPPLTRSGERRRRLTITRKIRRKPLKRLIPRPGLRRTRNCRPSRPAGTCFETRRFASLLSMRAVSVRPPPRRPTIARKIRRKPLKRLIPRPGLRRTRNFRPSRPAGTCFETRRFASLLSMRAASARPPPPRLTIARKFCCKPLKRLIPRPEKSRRADGAGPLALPGLSTRGSREQRAPRAPNFRPAVAGRSLGDRQRASMGGLSVGCPAVIPPPASSAMSPPAPACAGLRSRR